MKQKRPSKQNKADEAKVLSDAEIPSGKKHYVDNKEFQREMIAFKHDKKNIALVAQKKRPNIPNSIGKKILDICTHLAFKTNFINYKFRDDMISDGIQNCINYIWNYNTDKYESPFSYFSLIAHRAFVRRIQREKKIMNGKKKYIDHLRIDFESDQPEMTEEERAMTRDINEAIFGKEWTTPKGDSDSLNAYYE